MLLTRSPLSDTRRCHTVRLACLIHAASVRPEPGSNSPSCIMILIIDFFGSHKSLNVALYIFWKNSFCAAPAAQVVSEKICRFFCQYKFSFLFHTLDRLTIYPPFIQLITKYELFFRKPGFSSFPWKRFGIFMLCKADFWLNSSSMYRSTLFRTAQPWLKALIKWLSSLNQALIIKTWLRLD